MDWVPPHLWLLSYRALKLLLAGMCSHMTLQFIATREAFTTE